MFCSMRSYKYVTAYIRICIYMRTDTRYVCRPGLYRHSRHAQARCVDSGECVPYVYVYVYVYVCVCVYVYVPL